MSSTTLPIVTTEHAVGSVILEEMRRGVEALDLTVDMLMARLDALDAITDAAPQSNPEDAAAT